MPATAQLMAGALDLHVLHSLLFYDVLILRAAIVSGCRQLLSEDMQHGATFGGVHIVNPFLAPSSVPAIDPESSKRPRQTDCKSRS